MIISYLNNKNPRDPCYNTTCDEMVFGFRDGLLEAHIKVIG